MSDFAVTATDLVVAYGTHVAIERSTFTIPARSVTTIIGPNGSGKSTLLSAIAGLVDPSSGSIETPGVPSTRDISYVLQTTKVNEALPISVREVVSMGRYASAGAYRWLGSTDKAAIGDAMERMGISDLGSRHLHDLSGGQRQRVFVAQGLAQDHDILLLDEPLTGIDLAAAQAIDAVIHDETTRGCSVIMTTHDLSEAQVSDHVLLLAGRVVASGPPSEVLTRDHLIAAYGPSLLHVGESGQVFLDDPAHAPIAGRHAHRQRTIHTEASRTDLHGDAP